MLKKILNNDSPTQRLNNWDREHKNNYVSTMRMSQEENRISLLMSHSKQISQEAECQGKEIGYYYYMYDWLHIA